MTEINIYCHPVCVTKNIPFSLALRIVRTCTIAENRDQRLEELITMSLDRKYHKRLIESALDRAQKIPRKRALKKSV